MKTNLNQIEHRFSTASEGLEEDHVLRNSQLILKLISTPKKNQVNFLV
jgi:hypothetical protein